MWKNWEPIYQEAYTSNQCSNIIRRVKFQPFGGAALAEVKVRFKDATTETTTKTGHQMMDMFEEYLNNIAAAAKKGETAYSLLSDNMIYIVANNTTLTNIVSTMHK